MLENYQDLIYDLIKGSPKNETDILVLKRKFAKENKTNLITNSELLSLYHKIIKNKKVKVNKNLERLLRKRQIRTLSGVAPIAVLTKPYKCPGKCLYCPSEKNMPKSYLSNEPAVMRAVLCKFDPFKQVALRIKALEANGHDTDKIELIVMGGTWDCLPEKYRLWFVYKCFFAANNPAINIKTLKHKNPPTGDLPKGDIKTNKIKLFIEKYKVGGGEEYFLSYESKDRKVLYAFLRLRIPVVAPSFSRACPEFNSGRGIKKSLDFLMGWLTNVPIIRELHTYGQLVPIGDTMKIASQHKGLGKKLLGQAEKIVKQKDFKEMAVIAGIGVKEYYRKLGYKIKNTYMVKEIKIKN